MPPRSDFEWFRSYWSTQPSLEDYLNYNHGLFTSNHMTRQLAGALGCASDAAAAGGPSAAGLAGPALLARAKSNLARFGAVLIQEEMGASQALLRAVLGWPELEIPHYAHFHNSSLPYHLLRDQSSLYRLVAELNPLDLELYRFGQELYRSQLAAAGID